MSVRYNDDFKREVVRAYMAGNKSTVELSAEYNKQREVIHERIKYIYYNNNRTVGHRAMRVFLSRYGIHISKTTVHKYMNKILNSDITVPLLIYLTDQLLHQSIVII